jgi:hypothetical protein
VAQLGAVSATALIGVAAKSAAAAGATGLVTLVAATVVVEQAAPPETSEPTPAVESAAPEAPPTLPQRLRPQPEDPGEIEEEASEPAVAAFPLLDTPEDALGAEAKLIERARAVLTESPARALELVGEHQTRFPRGQLAAERTIVKIDALRRLGRRAEAEALASRVLAQEPKGLYANRVRRALGEK